MARNNEVSAHLQSTSDGKKLSGGAFAHKKNAEAPVAVGNALPANMLEAATRGVVARMAPMTERQVLAAAAILRKNRNDHAGAGVTLAQSLDIEATLIHGRSANEYPAGYEGSVLHQDMLAVEASGARFRKAEVGKEGYLELQLHSGQRINAQATPGGRLSIQGANSWRGAMGEESDFDLWNEAVGEINDQAAIYSALHFVLSDSTADAGLDIDGVMEFEIDVDGTVIEGQLNGLLLDIYNDEDDIEIMLDKIDERFCDRSIDGLKKHLIVARDRMIWDKDLDQTRSEFRQGAIKNDVELHIAHLEVQDKARAAGLNSYGTQGKYSVIAYSAGRYKDVATFTNDQLQLTADGKPVDEFDPTHRKSKKVLQFIEEHRESLTDISIAAAHRPDVITH